MTADTSGASGASPVEDATPPSPEVIERARHAQAGLAPSFAKLRAIPADLLASIEPEQAVNWVRRDRIQTR